MNEPVTRQRPTIDFDDFDRAVRGSAQPTRPQDPDPLAELARLVGAQDDPYGDVFARDAAQAHAATPRHTEGARAGEPGGRRSAIDFSAIEAGLRGTLPGHDAGMAQVPLQPTYARPDSARPESYGEHGHAAPDGAQGRNPQAAPRSGFAHSGFAPQGQPGFAPQAYVPQQDAYAAQQDAYAAQQNYAAQQGYAPQDHDPQDPAWLQPPAAAKPPVVAPRSRRPIYAMTAVIVAGVVGIGVAFAYKGVNSGPREIAMIKANPGPNKIQPTADETSDQPSRDASILDKAQQPAPTKLVSREEQPIDLSQAVANAPRDVGNGLTPLYSFGGPAGADAASVPVPAPPGAQLASGQQASAQSGGKPADALGIAADIEPIRVRTKSYRPDGTPIPDDQPPVAAMDTPPPVPPKVDKTPVAKASTPKSTTPKSTTRIATTPKPIVTASRGDDAAADANDTTAMPLHKLKPAKPAKPAKLDATANADDAGTQTASVQPGQVDEPAAAPGGGGFAVQLAAPGSEAEAKQTSSRLSQKFASELSGHRLGFHKASSNGKSVFRVRVGSLTREEATDMCEKLKSSGGTCFVAKNN